MTKSNRRILILTFAAIILVAGISIAFYLTVHEDDGVVLKGSVILRDTYILSTCELPNGKFCIWSYDFESEDFKVHARREHLPQLLEGSTSSCMIWEEYPEKAESASVPWFILSAEEDSPKPLKLDGVKAFIGEIGESKFDLLQADGEPGRFFVSLASTDETNLQPFAMFNSLTGEEIGRIPDVRAFSPSVSFIGPKSEYLAVGDVDMSSGTRIRLFDANTFSELGHTSEDLGIYGSTLTATGKDEFVAQATSFDFAICRVTSDSVPPAIVVDKRVQYPEQAWKTSTIVGLRHAAGQIITGGIPTRWYNKYRDVRRSYYRKGLIAWEAVRPPQLRIARVDDPSSAVDYPLQTPGEHEWPFQFSEDATLLVTRSAPDSFQILRVALPDVSVEQECRLVYDAQTDTLSLVNLPQKEA